ncbi:MAG: sigma-70 family RNA polymerase sigma factor [Myxococcota bacterium]
MLPRIADSKDTDEVLWQRYRDGNREAGRELYFRHARALSRVFDGKINASTDDMVQRTFLKALENASRVDDARSVRGYLIGIARNLMLDHFREAAGPRGRIDPMTQTLEGLAGSLSGAIAKARERHSLLLALRRVPIESQLLLELFYWEGLTGEELAEAMGIPEGTLRSRLRRARAALRKQMESVSTAEFDEMSRDADFSAWAAALREPSDD